MCILASRKNERRTDMNHLEHKHALLSYSNTELLKVFFEVLVLIHHLYITSTAFGAVLSEAFGPIAVGGFILLSGYGVGYRYLKSDDGYFGKLIRVRVPRTYLTLLIVDLCYLVLYLALGGKFETPASVILSVLYLPLSGEFVALSHWVYFLADMIIYYLCFVIFAALFRKTKKKLLWTAVAIFVLDLCIIAILTVINVKTGSSRYLRGCLCFPVGLLCAEFLEKLDEIIEKSKLWLAISLAGISIVLLLFLNTQPVREYLLSMTVPLALVVLLHGVNTKCRWISYLSSLVIYVYLSHEFFLRLFERVLPGVERNLIGLLVFVCSMAFAMGLHLVISLFQKRKNTP